MNVELQYVWLSEQVYWVEESRKDVKYHPQKDNIYDYNPENPSIGP